MFFRPFVDQQILMRLIFYMIKRHFLTLKLPDYSQPRPKNIRGQGIERDCCSHQEIQRLKKNCATELREETTPNAIVDKKQDKNKKPFDELVTFCKSPSQLNNNVDTPLAKNNFTSSKKPESEMLTVKTDTLTRALKAIQSCNQLNKKKSAKRKLITIINDI